MKNQTRQQDKPKFDLYQNVTDRIIAALESGTAPWLKPWSSPNSHLQLPRNAVSNRFYNGINVLLLWLAAEEHGYKQCKWITVKAANELGGHVRKGEKATLVVNYNPVSEPTCGSGVMVIGCINAMFDAKYNPQQQLWAHCQDVDFTAAMMCYIQLSLLHIPACIVVGDTLLNETKIQMYTLAHLMGNWSYKLEQQMASPVNDITETDGSNKSKISVIAEDLSQISISDEIDDNELIFY